jgi:hypothetical protein
MKNEFYAHSLEGRPPEHWHHLEDHLKAVAEMARSFTGALLISLLFRVFRLDESYPYPITKRKGSAKYGKPSISC